MIGQMNAIAETIEPNRRAQSAYDKLYPIFNAAYEALVPIYDQIAEMIS
jgi:sugar (pentulose or hexulose) kinase